MTVQRGRPAIPHSSPSRPVLMSTPWLLDGYSYRFSLDRHDGILVRPYNENAVNLHALEEGVPAIRSRVRPDYGRRVGQDDRLSGNRRLRAI